MNVKRIGLIAASLFLIGAVAVAQEMSKDEWQKEMARYTQLRNEMQSKLKTLTDEVKGLESQSAKLSGDIDKCLDDLYALVGSDRQKAAAYREEIAAAERKADELLRLSDVDLAARASEVKALEAKVKELRANRLSIIPEFSTRLDALDGKVASLLKAIGGEKFYTVGRWSTDRDCLWNIAKKKDIYDNAWLWPKIWQSNTDKIRNPDIIRPGQKLKVPAGTELDANEKAAARRYYANKRAGA